MDLELTTLWWAAPVRAKLSSRATAPLEIFQLHLFPVDLKTNKQADKQAKTYFNFMWKTKEKNKRDVPSVGSSPPIPANKQSRAKLQVKSPEFYLELSHGYQGPKNLGLHLLPPQICSSMTLYWKWSKGYGHPIGQHHAMPTPHHTHAINLLSMLYQSRHNMYPYWPFSRNKKRYQQKAQNSFLSMQYKAAEWHSRQTWNNYLNKNWEGNRPHSTIQPQKFIFVLCLESHHFSDFSLAPSSFQMRNKTNKFMLLVLVSSTSQLS